MPYFLMFCELRIFNIKSTTKFTQKWLPIVSQIYTRKTLLGQKLIYYQLLLHGSYKHNLNKTF